MPGLHLKDSSVRRIKCRSLTRARGFLAGVHIGIISISDEGRGPLSVPTWYAYDAGGNLRIMTGRESQKGQLLARAGRFSRCVQTGNSAVQVRQRRGAIVSSEARISSAICAPSRRYLGKKMGDRYVEETRNLPTHSDNVLVRMRPERWLTTDYSKENGAV